MEWECMLGVTRKEDGEGERERERESVKVIIFEWKLSEREVGEPWQERKKGRKEGRSIL